MIKTAILYIHGKGGIPNESERYKTLFTNCDIIGFDYKAETPWDAKIEFSNYFDELKKDYNKIIIIANSIGSYFALCSLGDKNIDKAYFISPIVDMEVLIKDMMIWANVTEEELEKQGTIETNFGETLSWEYLTWVKKHPVDWKIPTRILHGENDNLQSIDTIKAFVNKTDANLTVMPNSEHWFHTEEQMAFLDKWIKEGQGCSI